MNAQIWNFKTNKYEPYELPEKSSCFEDDMYKKVSCASCGKVIMFGDGYTSRKIHTKHGMGYTVCEECYHKEREEEMEARKSENQ